MIKQSLQDCLKASLSEQSGQLNIDNASEAMALLNVERPRQASHGDYAVNVSPLARLAKMAPPQIATIVAEGFAGDAWTPSIVGGFINFKVADTPLIDSLVTLATTDTVGQNKAFSDTVCLLEFVSANPTGPLHIGHGRWVALGDSLARLFEHCGGQVTREFYVNDAGSQIYNLAHSLWYRCLELLETGGTLPEPVDNEPYPFYPGDYVIDMARTFLETHKDQVLAWDNPEHTMPDEALTMLGAFGQQASMEAQRQLISQCGLDFDVWFSEKTLHEADKVDGIVDTLKERGHVYEKEGALWFKASAFEDEQDRVLIKSDGNYTYLTADIAYHHEKFQRDNGRHNLLINIWGADHHGYIARMKSAVAALGHNPDQLEIILGQLVNLIVDGERTRMGKRKKMMTLEELVEAVGVDAVRFWMVSKGQDTALDFDVDLAASSSDENPVFYVQYAHARCCSIFRTAFATRLDTIDKVEKPPLLIQSDWDVFLEGLSSASMATLLTSLENEQAQQALKQLILKMDGFEDKVIEAARIRSPHVLARYAQELAADFHSFYNVCRILVDDPEVAKMRLVVVYAIQRVLAQSLALLGVSAPTKM